MTTKLFSIVLLIVLVIMLLSGLVLGAIGMGWKVLHFLMGWGFKIALAALLAFLAWKYIVKPLIKILI